MSIPIIVPGTSTREQAITDIVTSVALEETAISSILNAESEKIEKIVEMAETTEELIQVNESVENMVKSLTEFETALQNKLELFSETLNNL